MVNVSAFKHTVTCRPTFFITEEAPGSDLAGEAAAALAAASIFYRNIDDDALADEALNHSRQLFDFANNYRGIYNDSIPEAKFYKYVPVRQHIDQY